MENVPGFYNIWDYTPLNTNFGIRGFWNDEWNKNIVFLVNGVTQRNPYDFNHVFSTMNLPVESIERIEIIRGPMSVNYGSGAFLGVINIITSTKETDDIDNIFMSIGTQNTYNAGFQLVKNQNNLQTDITVKFSSTDGIDQDYKDMGLNRSASTLGDLSEQQTYLGLKINSGTFTTTVSYDNSSNTNPIYTAPPDGGTSYEALAELSVLRYSLGYNSIISDRLSLNAKVSGQQFFTRHRYDVLGQDDSQESEHNGAKSIELDLYAEAWINSSLKFIIGTSFYSAYDIYLNLDVPNSGIERHRRELLDPFRVYGIYLQAQYKLNDTFIFSGGTRLEQMDGFSILIQNSPGNQYSEDSTRQAEFYNVTRHIDREKIQSIPQLSILIQLHKNHLLKLLYGEALSRLSFFNRQGTNSADLKNEKIQAFELNYLGEFSDYLTASLNIYRNNFSNMVTRTFVIDETEGYQSIRTNSGQLHATGIEISLQSQIQRFHMQISGSFQKISDENHKNIKPFSSPDVLGYFKAGYKLNQVCLTLLANYVAPVESRYDFELNNEQDPYSGFIGRIGSNADAYTNIAFQMLYTPNFLDGLSVALKINNLLDTKIYYPTSEFQPWATKGLLGISRTMTVKAQYSF